MQRKVRNASSSEERCMYLSVHVHDELLATFRAPCVLHYSGEISWKKRKGIVRLILKGKFFEVQELVLGTKIYSHYCL